MPGAMHQCGASPPRAAESRRQQRVACVGVGWDGVACRSLPRLSASGRFLDYGRVMVEDVITFLAGS